MPVARTRNPKPNPSLRRSPKRKQERRQKAKKRRKQARRSSSLTLEPKTTQIGAKVLPEFAVLQRDLHRSFQETELIARVVGFALIGQRVESVLLSQQSSSIRKLNFASTPGRGSHLAVEDLRGMHVEAR